MYSNVLLNNRVKCSYLVEYVNNNNEHGLKKTANNCCNPCLYVILKLFQNNALPELLNLKIGDT